jgi:hypothetical protein
MDPPQAEAWGKYLGKRPQGNDATVFSIVTGGQRRRRWRAIVEQLMDFVGEDGETILFSQLDQPLPALQGQRRPGGF